MSLNINNSYFSVVATSMAMCSVKLTLLHLITVRERLHSENFVRESDGKSSPIILKIFSTVLGATVGPSFGGKEFCDRCERTAKNAAENEPLFFLMAVGYGLMLGSSGSGSEEDASFAIQLIQAYTYARIGHTLVYLFDVGGIIMLRGMVWTVGSVCNMILAAKIFQSAK
mmetsp:Transcript_26139/g.62101  ORF Transcript_26139/g.62101 Transcript_26139/m.62101 type:complete len:170 (-) Transcript_26139:152-661(-)|eukprot:CAMPEP_0113500522 /NCGR_PEP_ID=MMETSP0014_2-20120614/32380_1 /TAXON_ID=2857 /ORGANISM="Nitzschia sp." /LENGTH=169 /DNA_ID=CAMNT_0000394877 /DNA_START=160 /DNA_END=669 /DNA_ORIENTATION=+ /assembly_acc=CAM_ASM_000159